MVKRYSNFDEEGEELLKYLFEEFDRSDDHEVFQIKTVLDNYKQESEEALRDALRKLQLILSSREKLKVTEVEKTANTLQSCSLLQIYELIEKLINGWKDMKHEWFELYDSIEDEFVGLLCPPFDEEAIRMTQYIEMDLTGFLDDIDDNGSVLDSKENKEIILQNRCFQGSDKEIKQLEEVMKQRISSNNKVNHKSEIKKKDENAIPNKKMGRQPLDETSVERKFESTKRKFHEAYEKLENEKKQRRIQVIEFQKLPNDSISHKNHHKRPQKLYRRPHSKFSRGVKLIH